MAVSGAEEPEFTAKISEIEVRRDKTGCKWSRRTRIYSQNVEKETKIEKNGCKHDRQISIYSHGIMMCAKCTPMMDWCLE